MKIVGIIPARFESSRFPGKPLADIAGKSMIQRVYEQVRQASSLSEVIVATDHEGIAKHVEAFGGVVVMTSSNHQSGTDRCQEVVEGLNDNPDVIINIQGDEPFIQPEQIDLLAGVFDDPEVGLATLIKEIDDQQTLTNPNTPKVVLDQQGNAVYFSRHPIPYLRGVPVQEWLNHQTYYKHIGIYGYARETLREITKLKPSKLEKSEALEQLRWLEHGFTIRTRITTLESEGIDTPEQLELIKKRYSSGQ